MSMLVPKTAMHKDYSLPTRQYDIGLPRKGRCMEPEAMAQAMQQRTQGQFRLSVPALNPAHIFAAYFLTYGIHAAVPAGEIYLLTSVELLIDPVLLRA